jgi:rare lipoprotein A
MSRIVLSGFRIMSVTRGPIHAGLPFIAAFAMLLSACAHHNTRAKIPIAPARIGSTETGVASWYGIPYHGRRAASGEIYNMDSLTAAHRKLPFQTWVEVTNLSNGKTVDVRINDRGPFAHGRIIDLSQAAARDIDMLRPGTARVRLKVIAPPREAPVEAVVAPRVPAVEVRPAPVAIPPSDVVAIELYTVQAGAFADPNRAESLRSTLEDRFMDARVISGVRNLWRVVVGREMTLDQANELATRVRKEYGAALVVPEPGPSSDTDTPK